MLPAVVAERRRGCASERTGPSVKARAGEERESLPDQPGRKQESQVRLVAARVILRLPRRWIHPVSVGSR